LLAARLREHKVNGALLVRNHAGVDWCGGKSARLQGQPSDFNRHAGFLGPRRGVGINVLQAPLQCLVQALLEQRQHCVPLGSCAI